MLRDEAESGGSASDSSMSLGAPIQGCFYEGGQ